MKLPYELTKAGLALRARRTRELADELKTGWILTGQSQKWLDMMEEARKYEQAARLPASERAGFLS
jgi:hypothetical protein